MPIIYIYKWTARVWFFSTTSIMKFKMPIIFVSFTTLQLINEIILFLCPHLTWIYFICSCFYLWKITRSILHFGILILIQGNFLMYTFLDMRIDLGRAWRKPDFEDMNLNFSVSSIRELKVDGLKSWPVGIYLTRWSQVYPPTCWSTFLPKIMFGVWKGQPITNSFMFGPKFENPKSNCLHNPKWNPVMAMF